MAAFSDDDIARASRAKHAALNTGLANAMAEVKLCEKQVAELQKKITVIESRLASGGPTPTSSMLLGSQLDTSKQELADISVRLNNALAQISKYKSALAELPGQMKDLMTSNSIASMQEKLAGLASPFEANDPASVIDEMKSKIGMNPAAARLDLAEHDLVAEADRQLKHSVVDDLLASYKQQIGGAPAQPPPVPVPAEPDQEPKRADEKTLGPSDKTLPPLD